MAPSLHRIPAMANEINNLAPVLLAIGRQIAEQKATSCRSDRPERDLPILLIPTTASPLTGTRSRAEQALPYLLGAVGEDQGDGNAPSNPSPADPAPVLNPPRQGVLPVLKPHFLGGHA